MTALSSDLLYRLLLSGFFAFFDDLLFGFAWHFFVMTEALAMNTASTRKRAQGAGITVELLGGDMSFNELKAAIHVHTLDFATPTGEIAHNFAHAIFGYLDFDQMNRF